MSRKRFIVVLILLIVILLVASALFGVLTYGLNIREPPDSTPEAGSAGPMEKGILAARPGPSSSEKLGHLSGPGPTSPFIPGQRELCQKAAV